MDTITVNTQDVRDADRFMSAYLQEQVPDADFSEGTAMRDFVIGAMAYLFAFLRKEVASIRDHQSLLKLAQLPPGENVDEAVDALLSNWFLPRKTGQQARVAATLHFSKASNVVIEPTTRFTRIGGVIFVPDITSTLVIPESDLRLRVNEHGEVDYIVNIMLVALEPGVGGNVPPGRFISADPFSPYFTFAENITAGIEGRSPETTEELLTRASTAVTVRNLVNQRSIGTVLPEQFRQVQETLTVGFGDPEMRRDLASEAVSQLRLHVGGHTDTYVTLNRTEVVERGPIGGTYPRPDGVINILRDTSVNFIDEGVRKGHVVFIHPSPGSEARGRGFLVTAVRQHELEVNARSAFRSASDETGDVVRYTVGFLAPSYDNIVGKGSVLETGQTSRSIRVDNAILLQGRPHYRFKRVEVINVETPNAPPTLLTARVNAAPLEGQYMVETRNPGAAQSAWDTTFVHVNPVYAGRVLQVVYETLVGYEEVQAFVTNPFDRVLCASPLVRGHNPVYVRALFKVQPRRFLQKAETDQIAASIANTINAMATDVVDVSRLTQALRNDFPLVKAVLDPLVLYYDLLAPDGQVYSYSSEDQATLFPSDLNSASLLNYASLREPLLFEATRDRDLRNQLTALGVSDRTIRYFCQPSDIQIEQVL